MAELFRLRVKDGKLSIPLRVMDRLGLNENDEIEFEIGDDDSISIAKPSRIEEKSPRDVAELERRNAAPSARVDLDALLEKMQSRKAPGRTIAASQQF